MNGLNNLLFADAVNNERIAERLEIALEELARGAGQAENRPRKGWARRGLVRRFMVAWARQPRATTAAR